MKKLIYLFIAVFITSSLIGQTVSVPNGDFEAWDSGLAYDNATGWESPDASLSTVPLNSTYVISQETTDAYSGSSSIKMECKDVTIFTTTIQVPGFITLGDLDVNTSTSEYSISGGISFTDRPDKLQGWFKYLPVSGDMGMFEIVLLNYDVASQTIIDTIGSGYFYPSTVSTAWDSFEANITYTSTATPNYMNINILSSVNTTPGSTLLVDNLELYTAPVTQPGLFFSEYIEGSSNNKGIEIFNPTSATINLDEYIIAQSSNGGGWAYYHNFPVGATLASGDVWVMITDQVDPTLFDAANADEVLGYPSLCHHNGDDARAIMHVSATDSIIIDIIGDPNNDPGGGWEVAGIFEATKNHTLVRKEAVEYGNTDWAAAAGIDSLSSEWIVYPQNEFSYLGSHNLPVNSSENDITDFVLAEQYSPAIIDNSNYTVDIVVFPGTVFTALVPTISFSAAATIDPASGVAQDFTNPVVYTVTSQSGVAQAWTITVTEFVPVNVDLFFSEYIEGSSNNKAIEIFNPTTSTVNLDEYIIAQSSNGGGWAYYHDFPVGATLAAGDVWVMITDQVDPLLFDLANADEVLGYPSVCHHNGDDARAIMHISATDSVIVDIFGDPNNDPGDGWDVAGTVAATKEHTLVRKPDVLNGNTNWLMSAGTDATNSEWIVLAQNDFSNLGIHSLGGNVPPSVSNLILLPEIITDADDVTISATVNDSDGSITEVNFSWGLDGVTFPNVIVLTSLFDVYSTYPDFIPAQVAGTTVYFMFEAIDNSADTTIFISSYTVTSPAQEVTIYEIQGQVAASPFDGEIVITSGIVTGLLPGSSQGYFVQDGTGAWNGVFVYDNTNLPAIGDEVNLSALVSEYYDLTELKDVTDFSIISSGNALPAPSVLSTTEINDEAYEGVFVRVENAECLNDDAGYGMWEINDGSGATLVHNNVAYEYIATIGEHYNVQGCLNYTFSEWKIELRMEGDVTIYESIDMIAGQAISIYPNPVNSVLNINTSADISSLSIHNILGATVYSTYETNNDVISIDMSGFIPGIYIVKILDSKGNSTGYKIIKE